MNKHLTQSLKLFLLLVFALSSGCGPVTAIPSPTLTPAPSQTPTATASPTNTPELAQPHGILIMSNARGIYAFNIQTREQTTLFSEEFSEDYYMFDGGSVKLGNGFVYFIGSTVQETSRDSYPGSSLDIFQIGIDGSGLKQLTNTGHVKHSLGVSPNERYITYTSNQNGQYQFFALDTITYETKVIATSVSQTRAHGFFFATWSSDNNQVAFFELQQGGGYSQLYLYDFENNSLIPVLPEGTVPFTGLAWSVDNKYIILPSPEKEPQGIYSFDVQSKSLNTITSTDAFPRNFAQSPDRKSILFELEGSNGQMKLCLLNVSTHEIVTVQEGSIFSHSSYRAAWSPDSQYIVYEINPERKDWQLNIRSLKTGENLIIPLPSNIGFSDHFLWVYP